MYPKLFNVDFLDSYIVMTCIGVVAALVLFRILSSKTGLNEKSFRFYGLVLIASIGLGFVFARLFQMLYNYIETGKSGTGITFLGGLIGGVAVFFLLVLIFGKKYRSDLFKTVNLTMPCIALGHFFGRIGCFMAGCCYGMQVDSFLSVRFPSVDNLPRLPTQLFEAYILLLLCASLLFLIFSRDRIDYAAVFYLYWYSVFRFFIEFLRDDHRGFFFLGLSPSQLVCIVMFVGGIVLNVIVYKYRKRKRLNRQAAKPAFALDENGNVTPINKANEVSPEGNNAVSEIAPASAENGQAENNNAVSEIAQTERNRHGDQSNRQVADEAPPKDISDFSD